MKPEECCQKLKGVKKDIKGGGGGGGGKRERFEKISATMVDRRRKF